LGMTDNLYNGLEIEYEILGGEEGPQDYWPSYCSPVAARVVDWDAFAEEYGVGPWQPTLEAMLRRIIQTEVAQIEEFLN